MSIEWDTTPAALWRSHRQQLRAVRSIDPIRLDDLLGVEKQKQALLHNTERFVNGQPCGAHVVPENHR